MQQKVMEESAILTACVGLAPDASRQRLSAPPVGMKRPGTPVAPLLTLPLAQQ